MQISEISDRLNNLASAWEHYKQINDQRLGEIEKKGQADPLLNDQLNKINHDLDQYQNRIDTIEAAVIRSGSELNEAEIYGSTKEHKSFFNNYLRKGIDKNLPEIEHKFLATNSDSDGGYLVTSKMSKNIIKTIAEISPMRQLASLETISSNSLDIIEDYNQATAGWTSEIETRSNTNTPKIAKKSIMVHELYAQPRATQKLIDDANIDIESWLVEKLVDIFASKENDSFINGDGAGKPRGILSYENGQEWGKIEQTISGINGLLDSDALFLLFFSLKEYHASRAKFLMHRKTLQMIRMLKDKNTGQYLYSPGLSIGEPDNLLGLPVIQSLDMPIPVKDSLAVVVADFKAGYKIVDRNGIRILRDPFTEKPFVKFYTTKRVGGDVTNYEAIKILKLSA
jgi:HK97 family phage major capsid protein